MPRAMTITEKIMARSAGLAEVAPGQIISARIGMLYSSELGAKRMFDHLKSLGAVGVFDTEKVVIIYDHLVLPADMNSANLHAEVRKLAKEFHLHTHDIGHHGVMHQVASEEGYIVPGVIAIGTDSHSLTGGALGAVVLGMGATDAAVAAAKGKVWLRVPESVKITLDGTLPPGTMSRDIMFYFMGQKGWDGSKAEWTYQAIEFGGETIKTMTMDSRLSLCNLASDTGAKNAIISADEITRNYLAGKKGGTSLSLEADLQSDRRAGYAEEISFDVARLEPQVACPHSPDNVKPLSQVLGRKIHVATVASCSNGRLEDLHVAASILNGRKVHPDVRMIVSPASQKIYAEAARDGTISTLVSAGVVLGHPTCGPCYGGQLSGLGDGEVLIGSIPRNLQGRQGSPKAEIYSANPAVVAASAIEGVISDPREFL